MEKEDEEFWNEVDERDKNLCCHCDGELCMRAVHALELCLIAVSFSSVLVLM